MDFRKKLKTRLYIGIFYIIFGIAMIALTFIKHNDNSYFSTLGLVFSIFGIKRIRQYFVITRSEESIRKQEIAETDERYIMLQQKSATLSFTISSILGAIAIFVLHLLDMPLYAGIVSYVVFAYIFIQIICYFVLARKY